jgi:uncharacterized protein (TIGR03118 family)
MIRLSNAVRLAAIGCALSIAQLASAQSYTQTNLVSNVAQPANADGSSVTVAATLVNPWGLARGAATPWWVNGAGSGVSALYQGNGTPIAALPMVTIPNAAGQSGPSSPTGIIFNGTGDFTVASSPALFIFATQQGTIAAWNQKVTPITTAVTEVDESKQGAVFLGLTWVELDGTHFLLAANFAGKKIEAFDAAFQPVSLNPFAFVDPTIPSDFAPYNVQAVGNNVVVTYATTNTACRVCGLVDVFTNRGLLVQRLHSGTELNAPWGVALAPQDFGFFSHDLLIGNRGTGTIAAFDPDDGRFIGKVEDVNGNTLVISGLWAIEFDNRAPNQFSTAETASTGPALFFAAGIDNYAGGLFGALTPTVAQFNAEDHE